MLNISMKKQIELYKSGKRIDQSIKKNIIDYLTKGKPIAFCPAVVHDELDNQHPVITVNPETRTDGYWTWNSTIEYYIDKYDFPLPEDFINHLININWKMDYSKIENLGL